MEPGARAMPSRVKDVDGHMGQLPHLVSLGIAHYGRVPKHASRLMDVVGMVSIVDGVSIYRNNVPIRT